MPNISEILKFDPNKKATVTTNPIVGEIAKFDPQMGGQTRPEAAEDLGAEGFVPTEEMGWVDALKSAAMNAPGSAYKYGSDIFKSISTIISHPVESAKAMGNIVVGAAQVLGGQPVVTPTGQVIEKPQGDETVKAGYEKLAPLVDDLKTRYGSVENFKKSVAEHPVEVLADISSVLVPASKLTGSAKMVRAAGATEPISLAMRVASKPFKLLPEKVPIHLYQSAVKFGTTLTDRQRTAVTKTALKAANQIMPTNKGLRKLKDLINNYNKTITDKINTASKSGGKITVYELYKGLDEIKNQFKRTSDEPLKWDAAFNQIKKQWKEAVETAPARTPAEVQKLKQNIYKDLESFYEKQKASPAKVELRKAVAKNARESLEHIIPEIKQLNKNEGALIALWDALETKANRITNRDLIGIGIPVKMGTGAGVGYMFAGETGGSIGTALGFTLGVFDTPQVKARIALVLSKLKEKGIIVKPSTAAVSLGLYQIDKIFPEETQ